MVQPVLYAGINLECKEKAFCSNNIGRFLQNQMWINLHKSILKNHIPNKILHFFFSRKNFTRKFNPRYLWLGKVFYYCSNLFFICHFTSFYSLFNDGVSSTVSDQLQAPLFIPEKYIIFIHPSTATTREVG